MGWVQEWAPAFGGQVGRGHLRAYQGERSTVTLMGNMQLGLPPEASKLGTFILRSVHGDSLDKEEKYQQNHLYLFLSHLKKNYTLTYVHNYTLTLTHTSSYDVYNIVLQKYRCGMPAQ